MSTSFHEQQMLEQTKIQHVEVFQSIDSTQDRAHQIVSESSPTLPALVVAERQTAGRGRNGSRWWSPEGALLFSLISPLAGSLSQPQHSGRLSLVVAEAVANFLHEQLPHSDKRYDLRVKPPNDIFVGEAKIAGLLIDVPHQPNRDQRLAIIGVGMNVNNHSSDSPQNLAAPAISLSELTETNTIFSLR